MCGAFRAASKRRQPCYTMRSGRVKLLWSTSYGVLRRILEIAQNGPKRAQTAQNGPQTTRKSDISHGSPEEASSCRDTYMVEGPNLSEVDMPTRVRRVRA